LIVGASCSGKEAMEMSGTRRKPGRLGPFVEGYRVWLLERGYTPGTVRGMLKVLGQLGRWMEREGREPGQIDVAAVEAFLAFLRSDGHRRVPTVRALRSMSLYLREVGVITVDDGPRELTPVEGLVGAYRDWLVTERGLAAATVLRYENLARRFLTERVSPADELGVEGLSGADVSAFLLRECARVSVGSAKGRVAELRSLLRFLYLRGFTELALADSVPSVAGWRDTSIPATMPRADVERLLASCERAALGGARNFAMLMLLARLGLRSVEVARLELSDLDWRAGELVVRGKARREDRLPLPADVGDALAAYLSLRGKRSSRRVFLTVKAPTRPLRADLVGDVVQRACQSAGIAHVGAHRLRHALATELLREGASLIDISQVLRHSDLATTAIYAKVDLGRLRQVARPWPGAER
jgi:site-specific recombinase XerD